MELWIRSQDKNSLKKVENIYIEKIEKDFDSWIGNTYSRPYVITCDCGNLGFYATKERALEVLDEIQNILNLKDMYKYDRELVLKSWENADEEQVKIVRQQMSVYEMPEE